MSDNWVQPPENTLSSLRHGISNCDGIELDLRITADKELIIHHDSKVSVEKSLLNGANPYVESWDLTELQKLGFCTFEELLQDTKVISQWRDQGKMVCLELKRPHPKSPEGGGFFGGQKVTNVLSEMILKAEEMLDQYSIPHGNSVFYAFHNKMHKSVKMADSKRHWAELLPVVPRFGHSKIKRMMAYPQYFVTPFSRLMNKHKRRGASMVPCAIEYFQPFYNRALVGKSVGLSGRKLNHFRRCQKGIPVYVWPANEKYEYRLLNSGITGLTDNLDPAYTWYKNGNGARWQKPATKPLDAQQIKLIENADYATHKDVIKQLEEEVSPWIECSASRKRDLIKMWKAKWNWDLDVDKLVDKSSHSPPWESVRLIGHRGSGKTARPVLQ